MARHTALALGVLLALSGAVPPLGGDPRGSAGFAAAQTAPFECPNAWPLNRAVLMYSRATGTAQLDAIAQRFNFTAELWDSNDLARIQQTNPDFYAVQYNSISDNYVPPVTGEPAAEHNWYFANAASYGIDPEDIYLHFWEDSIVRLEGQNITIPGWQPDSPKPGATAATRNESRVPVYYASLIRRAVNFGTPAVRAFHLAYHVYLLQQPIGPSTNLYWSGFMFDNAAFYNLIVAVVSGGRVAEHPTQAVLNSPDFLEWHFFSGEGLFMRELREYAATNPPALGGRLVRIIPNIANVPYIGSPNWERAYVTLHPGDVVLKEFEFSPVADSGQAMPATIFQKNTLAQQGGVEIWETGNTQTSRVPYVGNYTSDEALMNTAALHWVTRTPNVWILGHLSSNLLNTNPDTGWQLNIKPLWDIDLGPPMGNLYVLATGTDGRGYPYTVYARQFSCGLAVVRNRGNWNEDFDSSTRVTVTLPDSYIPVDADANAFPAVTQWDLRNGQGQLFVSASVTNPPCLPDWRCSDWSACAGGQQTRTCTDQNGCGTNNGRPPETQACGSCTPSWSCTPWSACIGDMQTRTCSDQNGCGTNTGRPAESQACTSPCTPEGQIRACTTSLNCPGTQVCAGGVWGTCADTPADNCPLPTGAYAFQNGRDGYNGTTDAGIAGPALGKNTTFSFGYIRNIGAWTQKSVIRFDLSALPAGSSVEDAMLWLYHDSPLSTPSTVVAYRLLRPWTKPGVTWQCTADSGQDGCTIPEGPWEAAGAAGATDRDAFTSVPRLVQPASWNAWNITRIVKVWVEDGQPNAGILLEEQGAFAQIFVSSQGASQPLRPRLEVRLAPRACTLPIDEPPCDCISTTELLALVQSWMRGDVGLGDFIRVLRVWLASPSC